MLVLFSICRPRQSDPGNAPSGFPDPRHHGPDHSRSPDPHHQHPQPAYQTYSPQPYPTYLPPVPALRTEPSAPAMYGRAASPSRAAPYGGALRAEASAPPRLPLLPSPSGRGSATTLAPAAGQGSALGFGGLPSLNVAGMGVGVGTGVHGKQHGGGALSPMRHRLFSSADALPNGGRKEWISAGVAGGHGGFVGVGVGGGRLGELLHVARTQVRDWPTCTCTSMCGFFRTGPKCSII